MKFLHSSDLHLGKRLNEFSLIEDQRYILNQIVELAAAHGVQAVLLSGDIYDKSVPSVEAVELFDDFITAIADRGIAVCAVSGNHDSPERMDFGSRIMRRQQVHIVGEYDGVIEKIRFTDDGGVLNVWLMPYLKPGFVNRKLGVQTQTFEQCVCAALDNAAVDPAKRNILLAHQYVTDGEQSPESSDSELTVIGGLDKVDVSVFDTFDYVALGHLHKPQAIGRESVRYSGSPLKYSFSECAHEKSIVLLEIVKKGELRTELLPLSPRIDLQKITCTLNELGCQSVPREAYVHITLTDDTEIIDAIGKVRELYPNVMHLDISRHQADSGARRLFSGKELREKTPHELFEDFFEMRTGAVLSAAQEVLLRETIEEISHET